MSGRVELRRAAPADAEAIAGVSVRAWHHAYADIVDPQVLFERTVASQAPRWEAWLAPGAEGETWVAHAGGRIAGYVGVGPSEDDDATGATGALRGLYVDPPAQGAGLGDRLHEVGLELLAGGPWTSATLWVFTANEVGRTFYERRGWALDAAGAGQEDPRWPAPSVRYRREV